MSYDAIQYLFVQVRECVFVCSFESVCVTVVGQGAVVGVKDLLCTCEDAALSVDLKKKPLSS